jgi:transposase-like protein
MDLEELWRTFPRNVAAFEEAFPDDEACRRYLVEVRWGGVPTCAKCSSSETWELSSGRFECAKCGYQMSVTAGTPMHRTKKPLKMWFRAMWEVATHRTGISAKDLQRCLGFGSYKTAWTWLHKLRSCMARPHRQPLRGNVQVDDTYFGGNTRRPGRPKPGGRKALVFVAVEPGGRVRLEHAPNLRTATVKSFLDRSVDKNCEVTTDGYRSYNRTSLDSRTHAKHIQQAKRNLTTDPLQAAHFVISLARRMWLGTYHGGTGKKHLQAYFDEFEFRFNRRKTRGVGRIMARLLHTFANNGRISYDSIVTRKPFARFETP